MRLPDNDAQAKRTVEGAMRKLKTLDADQHVSDICHVEISDTDSQVTPEGKTGFRRDHCSVVNIQRADAADLVEATTTIQHEAEHAHQIAVQGENGISREKEIEAHQKTIVFLKKWKSKESDPKARERIEEELKEEAESVAYLEAHN